MGPLVKSSFGDICFDFAARIRASSIASRCEEFHRRGGQPTQELRTIYKKAVDKKKDGRQAIGMEWALDQLLNRLPTENVKLKDHASYILAEMTKKKVVMPEWFLAVLKGM